VKPLLRKLGLLLAAPLPGFAKKLIYRYGYGYQIGRDVKLGVCFLDCTELRIADHARIGHGVALVRCGSVDIGAHADIGPLNLVRGGERVRLGDYAQILRQNVINAIPDHDCTNHPDSTFDLGYGAIVTAEHRIDFTDRVTIGRCTIFGGRNSSIWTHNRRTGSPVEIGSYCYIGSEIRMAPGARVPDCSVVGMGAVVTSAQAETFSLYAGVPARRVRALAPDDHELIFGKTRKDLPDQVYPKPNSNGAAAKTARRD
jgi:acetyltransferase-like isoleucine patch superfamily enzyme